MTKTYECMVLVHNQEVRKGWQACKQGVIDIFTKHHAEVLSARRWDERKLAYPIEGQQRATYLLIYFKAPEGAPNMIRRDLDFSERVLRQLVLQCEEVPAGAFEAEAAFDESRAGDDVPEPVAEEPATGDETETSDVVEDADAVQEDA